MKILNLTLKKKWFDMIISGEKTEEYREIKPYWTTRLRYRYESDRESGYWNHDFAEFDIVRFKNGYAKDAPTMDVQLECIKVATGVPAWGAVLNERYYAIELGNILSTANCDNLT